MCPTLLLLQVKSMAPMKKYWVIVALSQSLGHLSPMSLPASAREVCNHPVHLGYMGYHEAQGQKHASYYPLQKGQINT